MKTDIVLLVICYFISIFCVLLDCKVEFKVFHMKMLQYTSICVSFHKKAEKNLLSTHFSGERLQTPLFSSEILPVFELLTSMNMGCPPRGIM